MNKRKAIIITGSIVILGVIGGGVANMAGSKTVGAGTSPLITEVDQHEVRISNAENNIRALQTKTNTPDNPSNAPVPTVNSSIATNTATSNSVAAPVLEVTVPVTVVAYKEIVIDADTSDCEYTYSDGTTYRFPWKTTNPQGAWITDGSGQNGHWQPAINKNGFCDNRAIGMYKN